MCLFIPDMRINPQMLRSCYMNMFDTYWYVLSYTYQKVSYIFKNKTQAPVIIPCINYQRDMHAYMCEYTTKMNVLVFNRFCKPIIKHVSLVWLKISSEHRGCMALVRLTCTVYFGFSSLFQRLGVYQSTIN